MGFLVSGSSFLDHRSRVSGHERGSPERMKLEAVSGFEFRRFRGCGEPPCGVRRQRPPPREFGSAPEQPGAVDAALAPRHPWVWKTFRSLEHRSIRPASRQRPAGSGQQSAASRQRAAISSQQASSQQAAQTANGRQQAAELGTLNSDLGTSNSEPGTRKCEPGTSEPPQSDNGPTTASDPKRRRRPRVSRR